MRKASGSGTAESKNAARNVPQSIKKERRRQKALQQKKRERWEDDIIP
jgi:hypothetical protein